MNKAKKKIQNAEEIDKIFNEGKKSVLGYFDARKKEVHRPLGQRVNVDLPLGLLKRLDQEANRMGVPRQSLIKVWIDEKLRETQGDF